MLDLAKTEQEISEVKKLLKVIDQRFPSIKARSRVSCADASYYFLSFIAILLIVGFSVPIWLGLILEGRIIAPGMPPL